MGDRKTGDNSIRFGISAPTVLIQALADDARRRGITRNKATVEAIAFYLKNQKTPA